VVFRTLKARCPQAYEAFGGERKREILERYRISPCIEEQRRTYPDNPDKEGYLKLLERVEERHDPLDVRVQQPGDGNASESGLVTPASRVRQVGAEERFEDALSETSLHNDGTQG
jgi:hypothetical protein